ncbi:hypothetical protein ACFWY9_38920 [Amycolatopsis sp. NPDC059027]|uniref:hypothetical protein n=1 Tax=unclassified Amycolatopsis TaxID=2618356 RepID=UPI00366D7E45
MWKPAAALVCVLLLGACGGDDTPPAMTDAKALADAARTGTIAGRSAKFGTDVNAGTVKSKGQGQALFAEGGTTLSMTTDVLGDPLELRLVQQKLFVKVPEGSRGDEDDKPWITVSPDGTDQFSQVLGGSLGQLAEQNDPLRTIGQIRSAGAITMAERGDLDGMSVEHYWLKLDLEKLGGQLPAGLSAEAVSQLRGKAGSFGMELWIDDANRPRQIVVDLSPILTAAGAPDGASARITTRYTDWGTAVDVQAPPAEQVGTTPS